MVIRHEAPAVAVAGRGQIVAVELRVEIDGQRGAGAEKNETAPKGREQYAARFIFQHARFLSLNCQAGRRSAVASGPERKAGKASLFQTLRRRGPGMKRAGPEGPASLP